jgi:hypothetical protein
MKRRMFLASVGASGTAVLLWPRLIRLAFADASFDVPGAKKTAPGLPSARTRAQQANKPLFVIVVPADDAQKFRRGELWGEYLNHGDPAQLAPLARAEVQCATMSELATLAPDLKGEPLAVLVEPDGRAHVLDVKLPEHSTDFYNAKDPDDDATSAKRIHSVAMMVRGALGAVAPAEVPAASAQVVRSLQKAPPSGAHWANASGCGPVTVEDMKDDERGGYACGMGHVPAKSSRFLYFYAKSPQQREREWIAAQDKQAKKEKSAK